MQPEYTRMKINNEIEFCETADMDMKQQIERVLLRNRISYYIKWYRQRFFFKSRQVCLFCINESASDEAEQLIRSIDEDVDRKVRFLTGGSEEDDY